MWHRGWWIISQPILNSITVLHNVGVGNNLLTCCQVDMLFMDPNTSGNAHAQLCKVHSLHHQCSCETRPHHTTYLTIHALDRDGNGSCIHYHTSMHFHDAVKTFEQHTADCVQIRMSPWLGDRNPCCLNPSLAHQTVPHASGGTVLLVVA